MAKICLVNGVYPPDDFGGAENYVQRTAHALKKRGHDVSILTTTRNASQETLSVKKEFRNGIPVFRFYPLNFSHRSDGTGGNLATQALWHQFDTINPHAKRVVSDFLSTYQPDIVHSNNFMGITASAGKAISDADVRYVHTLHDYSLICPKSNLLREMTAPDNDVAVCDSPPIPCRMYAGAKRRMIGEPDIIVGPSQHVIDIHEKHGFFKNTKTTRIQHGIEDFASSLPKGSCQSVLYVGKHLRAKGLETLFEAARLLPNVRFHLCGTGPYDDRSRAVAENRANVEYHGFVSDERLRELRHKVSAAVVPSVWMENSPLTIYESFANALPVIGADIGGIPELVNRSRGRLFTPKDAEELANRIIELTQEANLRDLRSNAYQWAKNRTFDHHVSELVQAYTASI
ncbi:glycosyltransferase family 4 protein [Saliphagus infecundisoli]|uniref:Glycosyltransferase family 4 protein n=1 Tax=Saliphagus infecundisoli TaxID=1849069 RepID=A0ABD5QH16_9EURY|nr:glycosyltransferase family 4 protein [Saliphagus infecundisoli]